MKTFPDRQEEKRLYQRKRPGRKHKEDMGEKIKPNQTTQIFHAFSQLSPLLAFPPWSKYFVANL